MTRPEFALRAGPQARRWSSARGTLFHSRKSQSVIHLEEVICMLRRILIGDNERVLVIRKRPFAEILEPGEQCMFTLARPGNGIGALQRSRTGVWPPGSGHRAFRTRVVLEESYERNLGTHRRAGEPRGSSVPAAALARLGRESALRPPSAASIQKLAERRPTSTT